nr:MAG TPA: hypothetical protein [Caudoviricetes sp.]
MTFPFINSTESTGTIYFVSSSTAFRFPFLSTKNCETTVFELSLIVTLNSP